MKTMTLNLGDREMEYLEKVCAEKEMSKTAIMRLALGVFQLYDAGHMKDTRVHPPKYKGEPIK